MSRLALNREEPFSTAAATRSNAPVPHARLRQLQRSVGNRLVGGMLMRQVADPPAAQSEPRIRGMRPVGRDEVLVLMTDDSRYRISRRRGTAAAPPASKPGRGWQVAKPRLEPAPSNLRFTGDDERRFVEARLDELQAKLRVGAAKEGKAPSPAKGSGSPAPAGDPFAAQKVLKDMQDDMPLRDHLDLKDPVPPDPKRSAELDTVREAFMKSKGKAFGPMAPPDNFNVKELVNNPFVEFVAQHGGWRFSAGGSATVSGGGLSSPTGKASVGKGPVDVGVEHGYDSTIGHRTVGSVKFTPGRRDDKPASGTKPDVAVPFEYEVVLERDVPARVELVWQPTVSSSRSAPGSGMRPSLGPGGARIVEVPAHTERVRVETAPPEVMERAGRYFLFEDSLPR